MKNIKILFTALVLILTTQVHAQKNMVQTAWNYLKYDELDRAKEAIDAASQHEATQGSSKTWYYRGLIYQKMYGHEKFGNLDPQALEKATESFSKALEIDPNYEFKPEIEQNLSALSGMFFKRGIDQLNAKSYDLALISFENVLKMNPKDSGATLNCAYSAEKAGNTAKAKQYYNALIQMGFNDYKPYVLLAATQKAEKDTVSALKTIQLGRQKFPSENKLIIEELNIYLLSGKTKEALESIDLAIQADSKNPNLYFAKGTLYDKLNKKDEAAAAYKSAIQYNPDYFDANYNLGAMYFNQAAEMANKANDIPPNKIAEYDAAKKKFEAKFKEALPYLEKAHSIDPKDISTMESLKQAYTRLGDMEKAAAIKKEMSAGK